MTDVDAPRPELAEAARQGDHQLVLRLTRPLSVSGTMSVADGVLQLSAMAALRAPAEDMIALVERHPGWYDNKAFIALMEAWRRDGAVCLVARQWAAAARLLRTAAAALRDGAGLAPLCSLAERRPEVVPELVRLLTGALAENRLEPFNVTIRGRLRLAMDRLDADEHAEKRSLLDRAIRELTSFGADIKAQATAAPCLLPFIELTNEAVLAEAILAPAVSSALVLRLHEALERTGEGSAAVAALLAFRSRVEGERSLADLLPPEVQGSAAADFIAALGWMSANDQENGLQAFLGAIDGGLKPPARDVAARELSDAGFETLIPARSGSGRRLVIVDQKAAAGWLMREALQSNGPVSILSLEAANMGEQNGTTELLPYRLVPPPALISYVQRLAETLTDHVFHHAGTWEGDWTPFRSLVENELFTTLHVRLRTAFNAVEAIRDRDWDEILLVAVTREIAAFVHQELRSHHPDAGFRVGWGVKRLSVRRRLSKTAHEKAGLEKSGTADGVPLSLPPIPSPTQKPRGVVLVTQNRSDLTAPLPALICDLARDQAVDVLFNDVGRPEGDAVLRMLAAEPNFDARRIRVNRIDSGHAFRSVASSGHGAWAQHVLKLGADDIPQHEGVDYAPLVLRAFHRVVEGLRSFERISAWCGDFIAATSPAFLLVPVSRSSTTQAISDVFRRCGVPTYSLQMTQHAADGTLTQPFTDRHLVMNRSGADAYRAVGVPDERIHVVGSLRIDHARRRSVRRKPSAVLKDLDLAGARLVLVATQPVNFDENVRLARTAVDAVRGLADVAVVIKLHPSEGARNRMAVEERARSWDARVVVTADYPLYDLISAASVAVVQYSNVGMEASLMDCPVVSLLTGSGHAFSLAKEGVTDEFRDPSQAAFRIRALLTDQAVAAEAAEQRSKFRAANLELADGHSTGRIRAILAGSRHNSHDVSSL